MINTITCIVLLIWAVTFIVGTFLWDRVYSKKYGLLPFSCWYGFITLVLCGVMLFF